MSRLARVRRLAAVLPYLRARRAYVQRRDGQALKHHERVMKWTSRPLDKAFHATLLVLNHRSRDAKKLFDEVISDIEAEQQDAEREQYLLNYCRYYSALIDGTASEQFRLAARNAVGRRFSRLLPLPSEAVAP